MSLTEGNTTDLDETVKTKVCEQELAKVICERNVSRRQRDSRSVSESYHSFWADSCRQRWLLFTIRWNSSGTNLMSVTCRNTCRSGYSKIMKDTSCHADWRNPIRLNVLWNNGCRWGCEILRADHVCTMSTWKQQQFYWWRICSPSVRTGLHTRGCGWKWQTVFHWLSGYWYPTCIPSVCVCASQRSDSTNHRLATLAVVVVVIIILRKLR